MSQRWAAAISMVLLLMVGCVRPAEERAERDLEVGRADQAGWRVSVDDGLAAVRELSEGRLVLWGSAPSFELQVGSDAPRELEIEVRNCLPSAELTLAGSSGAELSALPSDDALTRKRWLLKAPTGDVQLTLAAPDQQSDDSFQFALMSDVQEAIDGVSDLYERMNERPELRFLLGAGDLTTEGESDQLERFQDELLLLRIPYFTTLGNHELGTHPAPFHDYFGRGNFQFRFHGVYFTLLDSASATIDPSAYGWLDGWLTKARYGMHVVATHIPPTDPFGVRNQTWASRDEASKYLLKLAEGRVDLTLYGHVHTYLEFENAGIPAFISGGGGANPERFDHVGRHFMVFDIDAERGVLSHEVVPVD
jgi:hypothetical protein